MFSSLKHKILEKYHWYHWIIIFFLIGCFVEFASFNSRPQKKPTELVNMQEYYFGVLTNELKDMNKKLEEANNNLRSIKDDVWSLKFQLT